LGVEYVCGLSLLPIPATGIIALIVPFFLSEITHSKNESQIRLDIRFKLRT
jgi:hypothetical protein